MQGQCPFCQGKFEGKPEWEGRQTNCPHCHAAITVHLCGPEQSAPAPVYTPPRTRTVSEILESIPPRVGWIVYAVWTLAEIIVAVSIYGLYALCVFFFKLLPVTIVVTAYLPKKKSKSVGAGATAYLTKKKSKSVGAGATGIILTIVEIILITMYYLFG